MKGIFLMYIYIIYCIYVYNIYVIYNVYVCIYILCICIVIPQYSWGFVSGPLHIYQILRMLKSLIQNDTLFEYNLCISFCILQIISRLLMAPNTVRILCK
jgi:hypothetical protein